MLNGEKKIQVKIGSMVYQLSAAEDPQYIRETAAIADELITKVTKRYPHINPSSAQVLALVNSVDAMRQAQKELEEAQNDKEIAVQKEVEIKAELARLREQFWQLKKDLLYYKNLCDIHEQRLAELTYKSDKVRPAQVKRIITPNAFSLDERQTSIDDLDSKSEKS